MYLDNVVVMTCDHDSNDTNQIQNVKYLHVHNRFYNTIIINTSLLYIHWDNADFTMK